VSIAIANPSGIARARGILAPGFAFESSVLAPWFSSKAEFHPATPSSRQRTQLSHIEESIERLSARIEEVIAPFAEEVKLLDTIPGVARRTAEVIIAECGPDMSRFPSASHLASWAGMCPGNNESGGKRRSGKTRKGSKWLRKALVEAAHGAAGSRAPTTPRTTPGSAASAVRPRPRWRPDTRSW